MLSVSVLCHTIVVCGLPLCYQLVAHLAECIPTVQSDGFESHLGQLWKKRVFEGVVTLLFFCFSLASWMLMTHTADSPPPPKNTLCRILCGLVLVHEDGTACALCNRHRFCYKRSSLSPQGSGIRGML